MKEEMTTLTINIPAELKRQAKSAAALQGTNLTDIVLDRLRQLVQSQSQPDGNNKAQASKYK